MRDHELIGKTVLITGASSGMGAATAIEAARRGAHVALVGRSEIKLAKLKERSHRQGDKRTSTFQILQTQTKWKRCV